MAFQHANTRHAVGHANGNSKILPMVIGKVTGLQAFQVHWNRTFPMIIVSLISMFPQRPVSSHYNDKVDYFCAIANCDVVIHLVQKCCGLFEYHRFEENQLFRNYILNRKCFGKIRWMISSFLCSNNKNHWPMILCTRLVYQLHFNVEYL